MSRVLTAAAGISLLILSACTQPAAQVEHRGSNSYTRSGSNSYSAPQNSGYKSYQPPAQVYTRSEPVRPVPMGTEDKASVSSIGVSDLSPPKKTEEKPGSALSTNTPPANQWTKKPRALEDNASVEKPAAAKLDALVSNDKEVVLHREPAKIQTSKLMWPVASKKVISAFGPKGKGKANDGINIASPEGEPVWAAGDGEIVYVGNELSGYGNMVLIKHSGGKTTSYAHLSRAAVDKYDRVKQGDIIGYVGSTGNVKKSQLHFALRDGKDAVDPKKYLSTNVAGL